jgi:hypothetical protein
LKIPHFQFTESKELIEAYQARDKSQSKNVSLKENIVALTKEIVGLKVDKDKLQEKYVEEINKIHQENQAHDPSSESVLPVMASVTTSDHQEINQQKEMYIKDLEEQVEQKTQSINTLFEEKQSLNKLLE